MRLALWLCGNGDRRDGLRGAAGQRDPDRYDLLRLLFRPRPGSRARRPRQAFPLPQASLSAPFLAGPPPEWRACLLCRLCLFEGNFCSICGFATTPVPNLVLPRSMRFCIQCNPVAARGRHRVYCGSVLQAFETGVTQRFARAGLARGRGLDHGEHCCAALKWLISVVRALDCTAEAA